MQQLSPPLWAASVEYVDLTPSPTNSQVWDNDLPLCRRSNALRAHCWPAVASVLKARREGQTSFCMPEYHA